MKSIRRLRSKKNKTKNKKRRGGAAAVVNKEHELKLFNKFMNIKKYVGTKYNYMIPSNFFHKLKSLNPSLLVDIPDEDVRNSELDTKMKVASVSLLLFQLVPCYNMVNEIIINIKMHMTPILNLTEQLSLSKELCEEHPGFVVDFNSMKHTKMSKVDKFGKVDNVDNVDCLSLLKKHKLLDKFNVRQEIQNANL
jgi:hypothetical protein